MLHPQVRRLQTAVHDVLLRVARRRGWRPAVLAYPGYGSDGRVRALGRVVLAPRGSDPARRRDLPGWRRFLTLESPHTQVVVEVGGRRHPARSDSGGMIDIAVPLPDGFGHRGQVQVVIHAGARQDAAPAFLSSPEAALGVVCDIDDTVLVTGIATPLRAAWRTFVSSFADRRAVPGMAELLVALTGQAEHVPVVYLSTGPWNLVGALAEFLERAGFPAGALLLTDWGVTPDRWFRDGRAHKRAALQRLALDMPRVRWTLVGDAGQHDPALYAEFARAAPDRVRAVLLLDVGLPAGTARTTSVGAVPVITAADGDSLRTALAALP